MTSPTGAPSEYFFTTPEMKGRLTGQADSSDAADVLAKLRAALPLVAPERSEGGQAAAEERGE